MITIASIPRAFRGHTGIMQRNAIRSWAMLTPRPDILLYGNEEGCSAMADEVGATILDIRRNEYGTPILQDVFQRTPGLAHYDLLCYVNTDIILMDDFLEALNRIRSRRKRFLMIGRRWNLDVDHEIDFSAGWQQHLREDARARGELFSLDGIDYFVFPRSVDFQFPAFAVGRPGWDNWFLYRARFLGMPVIDATDDVMAVHQNHDYGHVAGRVGSGNDGPEGDQNLKLAGGVEYIFTLNDSTHRLSSGTLRRNLSRESLRLFRIRIPVLYPSLVPLVRLVRFFLNLFRRATGRKSQISQDTRT